MLHDSLSRLVSDRGRAFSYDDAGHRLSGPGGAIFYPDATSDLWATADNGAITYNFDAAGNVTQRGAIGLLTADDGTVMAIDHPDLGRTAELRDYRNLRLERFGAADDASYVYAASGQMIEARGATALAACAPGQTRTVTPVEDYVYAGGRRIGLVRGQLQSACGGGAVSYVAEGSYLYFADKMDLAHAIYRASDGIEVWAADFDAFGNSIFVDENPDGDAVAMQNAFTLPGQVALTSAEGGPLPGGAVLVASSIRITAPTTSAR